MQHQRWHHWFSELKKWLLIVCARASEQWGQSSWSDPLIGAQEVARTVHHSEGRRFDSQLAYSHDELDAEALCEQVIVDRAVQRFEWSIFHLPDPRSGQQEGMNALWTRLNLNCPSFCFSLLQIWLHTCLQLILQCNTKAARRVKEKLVRGVSM